MAVAGMFVCLFFTSRSPWCVFDMHDQDSAYRASGEDSGHSPEHVGHGGEGGADPPAYHGQQQRYDFETHTHNFRIPIIAIALQMNPSLSVSNPSNLETTALLCPHKPGCQTQIQDNT